MLKLSPAQLKKLSEALSLSSMALPPGVGDVAGFVGDVSNPDNQNPKGLGLAALGLVPGIAGIGAAKVAAKYGKKMDHLFDAEKGIGSVPNNQDVEHLGAVHYMTPDEYLHLAEPLSRPSERSLDYIKKGLADGKKLGQPTLTVDVVGNTPKIINHDGRHRVTAIKELFGNDVQIPVHVIGNGPYRSLPKHIPPSAYQPQRETDETLAEALKKADEMLQRFKDKGGRQY